jgi:hypothetical protein
MLTCAHYIYIYIYIYIYTYIPDFSPFILFQEKTTVSRRPKSTHFPGYGMQTEHDKINHNNTSMFLLSLNFTYLLTYLWAR